MSPLRARGKGQSGRIQHIIMSFIPAILAGNCINTRSSYHILYIDRNFLSKWRIHFLLRDVITHTLREVFGRAYRVFGIPDGSPGHNLNRQMKKHSTAAMTRKRAQFLSSWEEYAQNKSFAGMTLAEFETKSQAPFDVRKDLGDARTKVRGLILKRDKADDTLNEDLILIAHAIRADKDFGEDCPLYRSLGFVPKSERKTGRRRGDSPAPPVTENAA